MKGMLDPADFAGWLKRQKQAGCGYLMGAVGQETKTLSEGSWLVQQYKSSSKRFKKAKEWLENAPRVFDCQGLADCYITEKLGRKINVYARNNYADWCGIKGKGRMPEKYRVPGAAVFIHSAESGRITHVGFLLKPVNASRTDGDWYVIEARGIMHGVVRTRLLSRGWNRWGLMDRYFDYSGVLEKYHGAAKEHEYVLGDRTLKKGRTGGDVRTLQELLAGLGYEVKADGIFGDKTAAAVMAFKESEGLVRNGIYGTQAHDALMREMETDEAAVGESPDKSVRIFAEGMWNVRRGPSAGHGIITVVRKGTVFGYISMAENGWIQIDAGHAAGWVSPKCAEVL